MPLTSKTLKRRLAIVLMLAAPAILTLAGCGAPTPSATDGISEARKKYPTPLDLAKARGACLTDLGWDVTVDKKGQMALNFPSSQDTEFFKDDTACLAKLGVEPDGPTPLKDVKRAYPEYKAGAKCLRAAGWPISPAPSLQTFIDTYETDVWFPWGEVPGDEWPEADKKCPGPEPAY